MSATLHQLPLVLPAIAAATPLRRTPVIEPTPDEVVCACCGGAFPGEATVPAGDGRVCVLCEVDEGARPVLRMRTAMVVVGSTVAMVGLVGSALAHGGWTVWRLAAATPIPSGYAGATIALLFGATLALVRAVLLVRESRQLDVQDAWTPPRPVKVVRDTLPVALGVVGLLAALTAGISAWV